MVFGKFKFKTKFVLKKYNHTDKDIKMNYNVSYTYYRLIQYKLYDTNYDFIIIFSYFYECNYINFFTIKFKFVSNLIHINLQLNIAIGTIILSNFVAFLLDILISMPIRNVIFQLLKDEKCDTSIDIDYAHTLISDTKKDVE